MFHELKQSMVIFASEINTELKNEMVMDDKKFKGIPKNYRSFILDYSNDPEKHGWKREDVEYILECIQNDTLNPTEFSCTEDDLYDSIGTFFEDGVCVKADIEKAVYWYERAIEMNNDLARSNLADILRKGTQGYPKDMKRAFELYKACGLPYAHYRCGEFYENGWGTEKDIEKARTYYTLAYKEGHGLAVKKLKEWNFLD